MWKGTLLTVCVFITGCEGSVLGGFDLDLSCNGCVCSNVETQQTAFVSKKDKCPSGWVRGSINECTNSQTEKVELKLMSDSRECPEGYTGGSIHDYCDLDPNQYNTCI